jgi:hypothetical protein
MPSGCMYNEFFREPPRHPKLVSVMEETLGRPLRLYSTQLFAKPALVGSVVPSHRDNCLLALRAV